MHLSQLSRELSLPETSPHSHLNPSTLCQSYKQIFMQKLIASCFIWRRWTFPSWDTHGQFNATIVITMSEDSIWSLIITRRHARAERANIWWDKENELGIPLQVRLRNGTPFGLKCLNLFLTSYFAQTLLYVRSRLLLRIIFFPQASKALKRKISNEEEFFRSESITSFRETVHPSPLNKTLVFQTSS